MGTPLNGVLYDGFDFAANGIVFTNMDIYTLASRINQVVNFANRDGGKIVQSQLSTKPVLLEGYYDGATSTDAQNMYDTLAAVLNRQERPLIVPHAGSTRTFTATPENLIIKEPDGLNRLTFSFSFIVASGSSQDSTTLTMLNTTQTTTTSNLPITVSGSVTARPLITIVVNSVTGGTGGQMNIRNARDLVGLAFVRNFVAGDTITIDPANYQIYINGVLTVPSGRFPSWQPGAGALYYSDTFTTRSVSITMTYKKGNL